MTTTATTATYPTYQSNALCVIEPGTAWNTDWFFTATSALPHKIKKYVGGIPIGLIPTDQFMPPIQLWADSEASRLHDDSNSIGLALAGSFRCWENVIKLDAATRGDASPESGIHLVGRVVVSGLTASGQPAPLTDVQRHALAAVLDGILEKSRDDPEWAYVERIDTLVDGAERKSLWGMFAPYAH